ncbi:MAG: indole-3-glycerol phosphate synthase TrpC [Solirubrobacterales bacterium]|nr:indole-3-glycerol phosphate synthase TrpC [Solirubrobacterales bacterium]
MSDVLAEIVADTRARVAERKRPAGVFADALANGGISVIAEHKRASPSAGVIREDLSLEQVVGAYQRGGAAALSILTEESRFKGSLDDIKAARAASTLPILRKDFIVDPYQISEAHSAGADAILLIVAALEPSALRKLYQQATDLALDVLVEVHNRAELEVALELEPRIIGINNRNLSTLAVDLNTTYELLPDIPAGTLKVAESGFRTRAELDGLAAAGLDAVLIGEALMRASDPEAACAGLTHG